MSVNSRWPCRKSSFLAIVVLFVLEPPTCVVFWLYLRHFCSDFKSNFTVEFSEILLRQTGWTKSNSRTQSFGGLGFTPGLLISGGLRPPIGTPSESTLSISTPQFALKLFPVCCAQDTGSSAIFGCGSPSLETCGILSVTHTIQRIYLELFQCFSYAWIRPLIQFSYNNSCHFWLDLKNNFTVEFSKIFYVKTGWINFWNAIFGGFRVPHLGLLIPYWWRLPKGTPSEYTLSIGTFGLQENFFL